MALTRLDSKTVRLDDDIKAQTQRFDVGIVFKLSLAGKSLGTIPNLSALGNLTELNLANNNINKIEGLELLPGLKRLNLATNTIKKLEGLATLTKLEHLTFHDNKLDTLASLDLKNQLQPLVGLRALYLQQLMWEKPMANGCCLAAGYKQAILQALPCLSNLDGERNPATNNYAELSQIMEVISQQPKDRPEPEIPPIQSWFDVTVNQPEEDWTPPILDAEAEKKREQCAKALDNCHMLMEVLANELAQTRTLLEAQQPG